MTNEQIIKSLLDIDFYKFTMGQLVLKLHREVKVKFAFKNRTKKVKLASVISFDDLASELESIRKLRFNNSELHYLRGTNEYGERLFSEEYLGFLKNLELPNYKLADKDGELMLEFSGPWPSVIYWETLALAIVNELYYQSLTYKFSRFEKESLYAAGKLRLLEKIKILKENPDITFIDFGTRRRFSRDWQDYVVGVLAEEFRETQFRGTSNVYLAMKYGIVPMGTAAHELFMVAAGAASKNGDVAIRDSQMNVLREWWQMYGRGLSIALTDTFGTDTFFSSVTKDDAHNWKGLRHDSGDPIEFGEKAIRFYEKHGVDSSQKLIVFSDGLDIEAIVKIHKYFKGRINTTFGWGTNLTNDLGFPAVSLVVKPVEADGIGLVKLSDNLAKAIGRPEDIECYKRIFGYTGIMEQECRY